MAAPTSPAPVLAAPLGDRTTARLRLVRFSHDHIDEIARLFAKPEVWMFPYARGFNRAETERFVDNQIAEWETYGVACWLAFDRSTDNLIGYTGLSVPHFLPEVLPALEVGWRFDPDVWGRGYASEGAAAALDEAFQTLGLNEVVSVPQSENEPSWRVCERLGMEFDRLVIAEGNAMRGPVEARLYRISRSKWQQRSVGGNSAEPR